MVHFAFQDLRNIFGFHKNVHFWVVLWFVEVGTGDPTPPLKRKIPTLSRFVIFFLQNEHSGTQNKINLKWSNWPDNTSPYCKTCISSIEWFWHAMLQIFLKAERKCFQNEGWWGWGVKNFQQLHPLWRRERLCMIGYISRSSFILYPISIYIPPFPFGHYCWSTTSTLCLHGVIIGIKEVIV